MTHPRTAQSAAFALALTVTLATLGSLNLLAQDAHANTALARAHTPAQTQAVAAQATQPARI